MRKREEKQKNKVNQRMAEGLMSSKFRYLNEQLYSTESSKAFDDFKKNPHLFDEVIASI